MVTWFEYGSSAQRYKTLAIQRELWHARQMHFLSDKACNGHSELVKSGRLPRSIPDITARDLAWTIAGMLLAYLLTLI
jgi:hypothetical protein